MLDLKNLAEAAFSTLEQHKVMVACSASMVVGLIALRRYFTGGVCTSKARMDNKTVLITGANTGIGKATAMDLAKRGARVLLACRDVTKAERAAEDIRKSTGNQAVAVYVLDLCSLKSVRQCAKEVIKKEPRLDVLINNAGVMCTPRWKTEDGFEMQFGVNHLGHFLFTNLLLDLLKKSTPSRIVNVSALAHIWGEINFDDINSVKNYSRTGAYSRSKLANVLFTRELCKRLKGTGVSAFSLHPGIINTELKRHLQNMLHPILQAAMIPLRYGLLFPLFMKTAVQGAQTTIHCAVTPDIEELSGKYFSDCAVKKEAPQAQDDEVAARLWQLSEEMVGLTKSS